MFNPLTRFTNWFLASPDGLATTRTSSVLGVLNDARSTHAHGGHGARALRGRTPVSVGHAVAAGRPAPEYTPGLSAPSLNALDHRSPSYLDVLAYLVDTGTTPATPTDVQAAFVAVHDRLPGPAELSALLGRINAFGMLA
ncbi:hypothetical protein [Corynebacterium bovis]|uniref:Uncharacterized protein n=1 Tax=Corynebacterium bovis TaxID=36808 RepID=A0A3R8QD17_9CORY|nr:hypothetical protein [Corynebacterium bovis]MDN8580147.1 hypothetical protein [Corynebacterium bovis]RRO84753.1 hypothetical protein CXF30_09780 [Corynebacterium bovis]RRO85509.1 hypothetical protein CXF48_10665 [Corynebacterium bovis]